MLNHGLQLPGFLFQGLSLLFLMVTTACTNPTFSTEPVETGLASTKAELQISTPTDGPSQRIEATSAFTPLPTATDTPVLVLPSPTPVQIDPLAKSGSDYPGLRFDSWSPAGDWLAYWLGGDDESSSAVLNFTNPISDVQCSLNMGSQAYWNGKVVWAEESQVYVVSDHDGSALHGTPCSDFSLTTYLPEKTVDNRLSPDGDYRFETQIIAWEDGDLFLAETQVLEVAGGQVAATFTWEGTPHHAGGRGWLTNDLLLIGQTVDQGIVFLSLPGGETGRVITDLMALDLVEEEDVSLVDFHADPQTGDFQILIQRAPGQPILLFSSRSGQVVRLPFSQVYPLSMDPSAVRLFSPDGKWLLLGYPTDNARGGGGSWLVPTRAGDGEAVKLPILGRFSGIDRRANKAVFLSGTRATILSFPGMEWIGSWSAPGFQMEKVFWSPDGDSLALMATELETAEVSLFVIQP